MPKMSMCSCVIKLASDHRTHVHRGRFSPVSWPELELIRHAHGKTAISDIVVVAETDVTSDAEAERLRMTYGNKVYDEVYPGLRPMFEFQAPKHIKRQLKPPKAVKSTRAKDGDDTKAPVVSKAGDPEIFENAEA